VALPKVVGQGALSLNGFSAQCQRLRCALEPLVPGAVRLMRIKGERDSVRPVVDLPGGRAYTWFTD